MCLQDVLVSQIVSSVKSKYRSNI